MITWFDALLVTLWAVVTALGARRGLAGLAWGLGGAVICLLANLLTRAPIPAALIALLLAVALSFAVRRLVPDPLRLPWFLGAGAVGGFVLGALLVVTLTLGFPIGIRISAQGRTGVYPSTSLPPFVYTAVSNSALLQRLTPVWRSSRVLQLLVVPDQLRAGRPAR
ncbi:hypothetical protein [Deinococcus hopiensis]|uniref:hypothetical protein n=1 Tax=Deinococcus hopiensis TaxID=309885 RepID=UPI000A0754EB|nr:hypothetical protein [Deinococcus hopiensis]